ncbi:hypothetical protein K458DRAFT_431923 [Lentithecium fluviatile CBS 122367]|uniref:Protein kinase domain-containing protein n=1 Tax=Lentithecium fluviatile CBS 122367 TaxID=1168545 RepID=A0A6G1J0J7_9PLEO|nr:hypothetical protein K458DRAFT_431923 [Lentithecium fluviatile CBS 122367]
MRKPVFKKPSWSDDEDSSEDEDREPRFTPALAASTSASSAQRARTTAKDEFSVLLKLLESISSNNVTLYPFSCLQDPLNTEPPRNGAFKQTTKKILPSGQVVAVQFSRPAEDPISGDDNSFKQQISTKDIFLDFVHEIRLMAHPSLKTHPNIQSMLGLAIKDNEAPSDSIGFVLEWAPYTLTTFFEEQRRFDVMAAAQLPWETKRDIITDVASALSFLHLHGVLHGDLKEDNVLVYTDSTGLFEKAQIADFGLSGILALREGRRSGLVRTVGSISRRKLGKMSFGTERLSPGRIHKDFDSVLKSDVYCFGFLLVFVLFGGQTGADLFQDLEPAFSFNEAVESNTLGGLFSAHLREIGVCEFDMPAMVVEHTADLIEVLLDSSLSSLQQSMEWVYEILQVCFVGSSLRDYKEQLYDIVPFRTEVSDTIDASPHPSIQSLFHRLPMALQILALQVFEAYSVEQQENLLIEIRAFLCKISYASLYVTLGDLRLWGLGSSLFRTSSNDYAQRFRSSYSTERMVRLQRIANDPGVSPTPMLLDYPWRRAIEAGLQAGGTVTLDQLFEYLKYNRAIDSQFRQAVKTKEYPLHLLFALPFSPSYRQIRMPMLVNHGKWDINQLMRQPDGNGEVTPLHIATYYGDADGVELLLSFPQCNIDALGYLRSGMQDTFGQEVTALVLAIQLAPDGPIINQESGVARYGQSNYTILADRKKRILRSLLRTGADPLRRCYGLSTLHHAILVGSHIAVNALLHHEPKLLHCLDYDLNTPLHIAVDNLQTAAVVNILLCMKLRNIDVNPLNGKLETPLDTFRRITATAKSTLHQADELQKFLSLEHTLVAAGCLSNILWLIYDRGLAGNQYIALDSRWRQQPSVFSANNWCSLMQHDQLSPFWTWEPRQSKLRPSSPTAAALHAVLTDPDQNNPDIWAAGAFAFMIPKGSYRLLIHLGFEDELPTIPFGIRIAVVDLGIQSVSKPTRVKSIIGASSGGEEGKISTLLKNLGPARDLYSASCSSADMLNGNTIRMLRGGVFEVEEGTYVGVKVAGCKDWRVPGWSWGGGTEETVIIMKQLIADLDKGSGEEVVMEENKTEAGAAPNGSTSAKGLVVSSFFLERIDNTESGAVYASKSPPGRVQVGVQYNQTKGFCSGDIFLEIIDEWPLELVASAGLHARQI